MSVRKPLAVQLHTTAPNGTETATLMTRISGATVISFATLFIAACALAACTGCASRDVTTHSDASSPSISATPPLAPGASAQTTPKRGYRLVFSEEFDGPQLDATRWTPELAWGPINRTEQQFYAPEALRFADGVLTLTASEQPRNNMPYTSGAITSYKHYSFAYGYVETRAKVPAGKGLWSAVWLMTREPDSSQEIDVMEVLGSRKSTAHSAMHWGTLTERHQVANDFEAGDLSTGFHTYAMEWSPQEIVWFIDGVAVFKTAENIPWDHMYLTANLAVGGRSSWGGAPDADTVFPAQMQIDYIRVYQRP